MRPFARTASAGSNDGKAHRIGLRVAAATAVALLVLLLGVATADAAAPTATVQNANTVGYTTAKVEGTVDPGGVSTNYSFQYATQADFSDAVTGVSGTVEGAAQPVSGELTGLNANTTYHLRLLAENADGTDEAVAGATFTTNAVTPPTVDKVEPATNVGRSTADLEGEVTRPAGADPAFNVNCTFEYVSQLEWDPRSEEQAADVRASGGRFTPIFKGLRSYELPYDATAIQLQHALEALTTIGAGNVLVSGGPGGPQPTSYTIAFQGALADQNLPEIEYDQSELAANGTTVTFAYARGRTLHDGHGAEGFNRAQSAPCAQNPIEAVGQATVTAHLTQLLPDVGYHYRLRAANAGGNDTEVAATTFTTEPAAPPIVVLDPVVNPGQFSAQATATINPNGLPTTADYEFSEDGGKTWKWAPYCYCGAIADEPSPEPIGEGTTPVPFDKTLREPNTNTNFPGVVPLEPNLTYQLRLKATNSAGTTVSPIETFKTAPIDPTAQTLAAGPVSQTTATLAGRVDPANAAVTYQFEWGVEEGPGDETYENVAPVPAQQLGVADHVFHVVSTPIAGLSPNVTYHYRLVVVDTETGVEVRGADRTFITSGAAPGPTPCSNQASRVGPSAGLPDCRAYEWVTPDLNNAFAEIEIDFGTTALADGSAIAYRIPDAPDKAEGSYVYTWALSHRGPNGWETESRAPKAIAPLEVFWPAISSAVFSADYSENFTLSTNPLAGEALEPGVLNLYVRKADGSYLRISPRGEPIDGGLQGGGFYGDAVRASTDFKHVFFQMLNKQLPIDPVEIGNQYEWFNGETKLVTYLPATTPGGEEPLAPEGGEMPTGPMQSYSDDGHEVLFVANGLPGLYLRANATKTTEVSASQKAVPDPNPTARVTPVGMTKDGSRIFFTSSNELTDDANTGETAAAPNDKGADLYVYDVAAEELTDLTVDEEAADAETGAGVQRVVAATPDGSFIYFVATGKLAAGGLSGKPNLYVLHDGEIHFITSGDAVKDRVYLTPNGEHLAFESSQILTGYDNAGHREIFVYDFNGALHCVSCRSGGEPPTGNAKMSGGRTITDDGSRVFFESDDPLLPQATNRTVNVYEYEAGQLHLMNPGDASAPTHLLDASANGNDVFVATHQEFVLGTGSPFSIYDARVNAEVTQPIPPQCSGENCLGAPTSAPNPPGAGTAGFRAPLKITGPGSAAVKGTTTKLRISVPGAGQVTVSGNGIVGKTVKATGPGMVDVTAALNKSAKKTRAKKGKFKTKARVVFKSSSGETAVVEVPITYSAAKQKQQTKKGGK